MSGTDEFCLKWNNHHWTISNSFEAFLQNSAFADCTLSAEGQFVKAHKMVLAACSPYFEALLSQQLDKHPIFIMNDMKFKDLLGLMDYMYKGEVFMYDDQVPGLLKAGRSLQIKGLSEEFENLNVFPDEQNGTDEMGLEYEGLPVDLNEAKSANRSGFGDPLQLNITESRQNFLLESDVTDFSDSSVHCFQRSSQPRRSERLKSNTTTSSNLSRKVADGPLSFKLSEAYSQAGVKFDQTKHGTLVLVCNGLKYYRNRESTFRKTTTWRCAKKQANGCKARADTILINGFHALKYIDQKHNH